MLHADSLSKPLNRTDVYLSEFQRDSLKELAGQQDVSMAELIRRVLEKHLRRVAVNTPATTAQVFRKQASGA
jgi:predicted DNA-binding ribbon-helix-helix protein